VTRLVQADLAAARQGEMGESPPARFGDICEGNSSVAQVAHRGVEVVAHQVQLVGCGVLAWVHRHLGWGKFEYEPPVAGVDMRISQDVTEEPTVSLGILAVDDEMRSINSHSATVARLVRRPLNFGGAEVWLDGLVDCSLQVTIGTWEQRHSNVGLLTEPRTSRRIRTSACVEEASPPLRRRGLRGAGLLLEPR